MDENQERALLLAVANLDRQYGKGTIMRLGDAEYEPWPTISTGALTLDVALGIGGLPKGRIVECFGPESAGKTTMALNVVAQAQHEGGTCAYVDTEHALDPTYARALGVDLDSLYLSQPDYGEAALEIVDTLVRTNALAVIVVDSVAALTPKAEIEGAMGDSHVGLHPRLMSQAMRKLAGPIRESGTLLIFINQIREKIGVVYGNPETTTGGRALKFYASVRIEVRRKEDIKDDKGTIIGVRTRAKVLKNKLAPPFRQCEFDILWGKGIDVMGCLLDVCLDAGIFTQKGSWLYYHEDTFARGRRAAIERLASDLALADSLKNELFHEISLSR